jgi:hypothetical protein
MAANVGESPKDKFERLVDLRVRNIEEAVRKFSQLSNAYIYAYDAADVEKHFTSIVSALDDARARFDDGLRRQERLRQKQEVPVSQGGGWVSARERLVKKAR